MPASNKFEYTPVIAPDSCVVHATSLKDPMRTACSRSFSGWTVSCRYIVTCKQCKLRMIYDCRSKR